MPIQVKDTAAIARKYATRAQAAGADYGEGVKTTPKDWAGNTQAAAASYAEGVQAAIARGGFQKGVSAAGTEKWRSKAATMGVARYPQGVAGAEPAYATGFGPYADALRAVSLPPRAAKGSPTNIERVRAVADALHRKKTGG